MSLAPDPDALRAQATRLVRHAEHVRTLADEIEASAGSTPWQGPASGRCRHQIATLATTYRNAAAMLTSAAQALRGHAATLEDRLAVLSSLP